MAFLLYSAPPFLLSGPTLDGTVAFLYDLNLIVATKDLPSIRRIYQDANEEHQRLYGAFRAAEKALREGSRAAWGRPGTR